MDAPSGGAETNPFRHIQYAMNLAVAGDTIFIMPGTYPEQVTGVNSGTADNYITIRNYNSDLPIIDGSWMTTKNDGLMRFGTQHHINISGLKVANSSAYGIFFPYPTSDIIIQNCDIYSHSLSGIYFYPANPNYTYNVLIDNNTIHDCQNWWNHQGMIGPNETVTISNVDGFSLSRNIMYFNHKITVDCKNNARNGLIYGNIIDDYAYPNNGAHGIYIDGYDDNAMNIDIFNNIVYGPFTGYTIGAELGGTLTNIRMFNNVYYGVVHPDVNDYRRGFQINNHWTTKASNCTAVSCSGDISNCCDDDKVGIKHVKQGCSIINNTVTNATYGFFLTDRSESFYYHDFIVRNNIFDTENGILIGSGGCDLDLVASVDHNLYSENASSAYWGTNYIKADPLFVDPANHNYHLQSTSPCIGYGNPLNAPAVDFDGLVRGSMVDLGAYEYGVTYGCDDRVSFLVNVI